MRLYAIRDRLIDYYLRPFAAEGDKEVLASLSETINNAENKAPIAQTPSHFELWRLADFDQESGTVTGSKELLADCASLVRGDLRETVATRTEAIRRAAGGSTGEAGKPRAHGRAGPGAAQGASQAEIGAGEETHRANMRGAGPVGPGED